MRAAAITMSLALVWLPACRDAGSRLDQDCFSLDDCGAEEVCFLGRCTDPGFSLDEAYAELSPPNDSGFQPQQASAPLDLGDYQEVRLAPTVTFAGALLQDGAPLGDGGTLVATGESKIPGRDVRYTAVVSPESGFALRAVPGAYALRFLPTVAADGASGLPAIELSERPLASDSNADLTYPSLETLVSLRGRVRYSTSIGDIVAGALVSAEAEDDTGTSLLSSIAVTDAQGEYTLVFPPGAARFFVTVRPAQNPNVPATTAELLIDETDSTRLQDLVLGVEAPVSVTVEASDQNGQAVAGATVHLLAEVGDLLGSYSARGETSDAGAVTLAAIPGTYRVVVAPTRSGPDALSVSSATISTSTNLHVEVPRKIHVSGRVRAHDGAAVARARISASLLLGPSAREYSIDTSEDGTYELRLDPAPSGETFAYELTVEPERQSGQPRHRAVLNIEQNHVEQDIKLFAPTFVFGRVLDPYEAPLANVTLVFYALLGDAPVIVGVGQTSSAGEFAVPLPTP